MRGKGISTMGHNVDGVAVQKRANSSPKVLWGGAHKEKLPSAYFPHDPAGRFKTQPGAWREAARIKATAIPDGCDFATELLITKQYAMPDSNFC
jgi:hypothetical protein